MRKFKKIYIEITNICNLKCEFCPKTNREKEFMDLQTFSHILDEIKDYTNYIYLHIKGEPLLHPNLEEFLIIAENKGFKVNITTNGTLINKVKNILINKPGLRQINFSLHSINPDNYELLESIINFSKDVSNNGIYVNLRLWNLTLENELNKLNNKNKVIVKILENAFSLPFKIEEKVNPNNSIKLANNIYLNQDHEFQWPDLEASNLGVTGFCYGLRTHLGILVDGTVVPCCLDGEGIINLGNIKLTSFKDIINSQRAKDIYDGFTRRQAIEELCKHCGYRTKIKRP
ncbi:MAG: radical SAM/SPASM domain-containing protein [Bacilli bacterium]|nr:SPASM domain-containing protein [Bacilli bacterium]